MQHVPAPRPTDYEMLMQFLYEVRHPDLGPLSAHSTQALTEDSFRQFYTFLGPEVDGSNPWYAHFRRYLYVMMDRLDRPRWEADWVLRSIEFARFSTAVEAGECQECV